MWWILAIALATGAEVADQLRAELVHFVEEPQQVEALIEELNTRLQQSSRRLMAVEEVDQDAIEKFLRQEIVNNLAAKRAMTQRQPFALSVREIGRTVFDYEIFKLESYVRSGVFPKRYFGYFDLKYDTAQWEWELREATHCATGVINALQEQRGSKVRVNDAEIAVTFIAEGGALFLLDEQEKINALHPVYDVGLDDLASGHHDYPELIPQLDSACGTDLAHAVVRTAEGADPPTGAIGRLQTPPGEWAWAMRNLRFKEGIVATAMMWIWEKEIATRKLQERGGKDLDKRDIVDQFIIGSLVYNSGIVHAESTIAKIRDFSTGPYLWERSNKNEDKTHLNLLPPPKQLTQAISGTGYQIQDTSWLAAYHVLQRYGAWEGLRRFTDTFDESGAFTPRERPRPFKAPVKETEPKIESTEPTQRGCQCSTAHLGHAWWVLLLLALAFRHKMPSRLPKPSAAYTVNTERPFDVRRT